MFEPRLTLVPEPDGEFSLFSETDVPSDFYTARKIVRGAPKGTSVGKHVVAVRLPLKYRAAKKAGPAQVVHHRAFNLGLREGTVVKAFLMLDDRILGVSSVIVTAPPRPLRRMATAAAESLTRRTMDLTQELCQTIVVEETPDPDAFREAGQQLFELGIIDPPRARFHRIGIQGRISDLGHSIKLEDITTGPEVAVDVCRDSVFQNAR
jgi:hypothetical protein